MRRVSSNAGQRQRQGRAQGKVGVGDDLQACQAAPAEFRPGPFTTSQASFICGKAEIFERPLSVKLRASVDCSVARTRCGSAPRGSRQTPRRQPVPCRVPRQKARSSASSRRRTNEPVGLLGWTTSTARACEHRDTFPAWANRSASPVINQRIRDNPNIVQPGQKIEERVARLRRQDGVPRLGEKAENVGISFAGAGGQEDLPRIERDPSLGVVSGHRLPRREQAARVGFIRERPRICQRSQDALRIESKPAARGVRFRQINETSPLRRDSSISSRQPVRSESPIGAGRKHKTR